MKFKARTNSQRCLEVNWEQIDAYLSRYKPDTYVDIEITRRVAKKSSPLRKYYFAVVLPKFSKHLGYDADENLLLHRQLKIVYFRTEPDGKGIYRKVPKVFSDESEVPVKEKSDFVEWVKRTGAKEGCYIPDANEK